VQQELRVEKKDVVAAESALKAQVLEAQRLQEDYAKRIESLNLLRANEMQLITQYKQRAGLSSAALEALYSWNDTPSTASGWQAQVEMGRLHNHIAYEIDILKDTLIAKAQLEKARVTELEVQNSIIRSWQMITSGTFDGYNSEDLPKDIKSYEKMKADIQTSIAALADKRAAASAALTNNARIAEAVKARFAHLESKKILRLNQRPMNLIGLDCY